MAEQTPTDELGIPLLIVPDGRVRELLTNSDLNQARQLAGEDFVDPNHIMHPRRSPELMSLDGKAVRESRIQFVLRSIHNTYHREFEGPWLPKTGDERMQVVVPHVANYIPRQAISLRGTSPRIVTLSNQQIHHLQTSGEVRMVQSTSVRDFLRRQVLANPETRHIPRPMIDEFITLGQHGQPENAYDRRRHQFLAHKLLSLVIDPATEPIRDIYRQGRREHLWQPEAHMSPRHVIRDQLLGQHPNRRRNNMRAISGQLCVELARRRAGLVEAA